MKCLQNIRPMSQKWTGKERNYIMKCNNCGNAVSNASKDLICPSCGEKIIFENIDDLVAYVIAQEGLSIVSKRGIFISTLRDYAPYLNDEIRLVKIAVDAGVYDELIATDGKGANQKKVQIKKSIETLKTSYFLDEQQATRSVKIIVDCMGWHPTLLNGVPFVSVDNTTDDFISKYVLPFFKKTSNVARIIVVALLIVVIILFVSLVRSCSNNTDNDIGSNNDENQSYYDDNNSYNDDNNYENNTTSWDDTDPTTTNTGNDVIVPNFDNEHYQNALDQLYDLGIKYKTIYEANDTIEENCVIKTEPKAGEKVKSDSTITIYISSGFEINNTDDNDNGNSDSQTTTTTQPEYVEPTKVKITGNTISGSIKDEEDEFYYTFTPTVSGIHRFDFDISNVNADYRFRLITSKQATKGPYYYSSKNMSIKDHGISLELTAGETYTIIIDYYKLACDYTVKIGKPESVKKITGSSISGSIKFTDEVDEYKYTAPKTGRYRFDFDISDTNADYGFKLITSKQSTKGPYYYSSKGQSARNHGVSIDLTAGETYTIKIFQETKTCNYTVNIGVPTDNVSFSGKSVNGSFKFLEQENTYTYVASKSGTYTFYMDVTDTAVDFDVLVKNSKNTTVRSTNYAACKYAKVRAEFTVNMTAGETYKIILSQDYRLCDYTLEVSLP